METISVAQVSDDIGEVVELATFEAPDGTYERIRKFPLSFLHDEQRLTPRACWIDLINEDDPVSGYDIQDSIAVRPEGARWLLSGFWDNQRAAAQIRPEVV